MLGGEGAATLKIIEVLKKVRGVENIFELLQDEEKRILTKIGDLSR